MLAVPLVLLLAACAHHNPLATWAPSPNFDARGPALVVLHYTAGRSAQESLRTLQTANSGGRVSAHYLVARDGTLYQLVDEHKRAWHAGPGRWGTITDVNAASIGIEIDNDGRSPYSEAQIARLIVLLEDLVQRLGIPRWQVIGHEDMAPGRKIDPGPLFPWKRLHDAGFGLWPAPAAAPAPPGFDGWLAMAAIGYPLDDRAAALRSFRHRFRGIDVQGAELDAEDLRILHDLARQRLHPGG
nr:N-acetylmuramoyl-L-alanine amidase [Stenotrophomonas mori]